MTIFERIIAREIPSTIEYEDNDVIVIRDIAPVAPVHLLIIPKTPISSINEVLPEHQMLLGKIFLVAKEMAQKFGIAEDGYRIVTNVNANAGQTVFHLHFHLLGGENLGGMVVTRTNPSSADILSANKDKTVKKHTQTIVRDSVLFIVAACGLALGFNTINVRRIPWMKPPIERIQATDSMLILQDAETDITTGAEQNNPPVNISDKKKPIHDAQPNRVSGVDRVPDKPDTTTKRKSAFTQQPGVVLEINLAQFEKLLSKPHLLIDARTPESYAKGHISNAVNVYGGEVESKIPELMSIAPTDKPILIYCDGGECELSHHVAHVLKTLGYGPMYIFTGGWAEWSKR